MNRSTTSLSKKGISLCIILLVWHLLSRQMDSFVLPGPLATLSGAWDCLQDARFYQALLGTLFKLLVGVSLAVLVGGGLGLLMGGRPQWKDYWEPVIDMMQSVPPIAWLGIAIIWFGLTDMPAIFIIVLSCTPVLFTNVYEGFQAMDAKLLRMAAVFHVPRRKVLTGIILPSLRTHLKAGLIISSGLGWKLAVMAELLTSAGGLGGLLSDARTNLDTQKVFALALFMAVFWNLIKLGIGALFRNRADLPSG